MEKKSKISRSSTAAQDPNNEIALAHDRFNRVLNSLKDEFIFFSHHRNSMFEKVSDSIKDLLGYTPDQFRKSLNGIWTDNPINSEARKYIEQSFEGISQQPYEIELYHKDGSRKKFEVRETPVSDDNGRVKAVEGVLRDVTLRHKIESMIDHLPGMAYRLVKKRHWEVDFVSRGVKTIIGYEPSFFVGKSHKGLWRLIHPDDQERVQNELLRSIIKKKKPAEFEYRIIDKNGNLKWVFDKAEGVLFSSGEPVVIEGLIIDFTFFKEMEQRLKHENNYLRSTIKDRYKFDNIIGNCQAMQEVYDLILKAASTDDNVFIYGESGTGKELIAHAIHNASNRSKNNFITVNCGAIPENLIESEFFGSKKGAFTGSTVDKKGYLDKADKGTLFLDEIGEISLPLQVKLLRAIEGGGYSPVGSTEIRKPNFRIIAASNKDMVEFMKKKKIREDFFFRIYVLPINLPPLRDRGDDLFLIADHFVKLFGGPDQRMQLSSKELIILKNYHWPGNVRELQNVIRRYLAFNNLDFLNALSLSKDRYDKFPTQDDSTKEIISLRDAMREYEKLYIEKALSQNHWHKKRSADCLQIDRKTLFRKMRFYGLE